METGEMKPRELTYQEALDIVEKFMIDSGIREYCTEICKGGCCMDCYENNPNSCRHCEGRRLSCSIYTCYELREHFPKKTGEIIIKVGQDIRNRYYKCGCKSVYFNVPSKTFFEVVRFPISIKINLKRIDVKKIKNIMTPLIESKKIIYKR